MDANCIIFPGTSAALAVIFAQQCAELLGYTATNMIIVLPIALGVIILLAALNNISSSFGGAIQNIATIGKLVPLILIIIFGFVKGRSEVSPFTPMVGPGVSTSTALGHVLISTLFAYDR